jgi:hypothetical protein
LLDDMEVNRNGSSQCPVCGNIDPSGSKVGFNARNFIIAQLVAASPIRPTHISMNSLVYQQGQYEPVSKFGRGRKSDRGSKQGIEESGLEHHWKELWLSEEISSFSIVLKYIFTICWASPLSQQDLWSLIGIDTKL